MCNHKGKICKYFTKHPHENSMAHLFIGVGVGFLLAYPLAATHPVRWGVVFIVLGLVIHARAMR